MYDIRLVIFKWLIFTHMLINLVHSQRTQSHTFPFLKHMVVLFPLYFLAHDAWWIKHTVSKLHAYEPVINVELIRCCGLCEHSKLSYMDSYKKAVATYLFTSEYLNDPISRQYRIDSFWEYLCVAWQKCLFMEFALYFSWYMMAFKCQRIEENTTCIKCSCLQSKYMIFHKQLY